MAMQHVNLDTLVINGSKPFYDLSSSADDVLGEAHAMLTVLASAYDLSSGFGPDPRTGSDGLLYENTLESLRPAFMARALDGIARLVAVATYLNDAAFEERAAR
jgi:hypothetical protein